MSTTKIDIESKTVVRVMLVIVIFMFTIYAVYKLQNVLVWLLIAFFLALALNPPVSYLSKRIPGNSRALATGISYLVVLSILAVFAFNTVPPLVSETKKLVQTIPQKIETIKNSNQSGFVKEFIERYDLEEEAQQLATNVVKKLGDSGGPVLTGIGFATSSLIAFVTILVLTFFMLVEAPQWLELMWRYHPKERREHHKKLALRMYRIVTSYVNGQLVVASIAGLTSLVAMVIVGLPNPIALAGVITMTALVPMIGATLGALIVVVVALFQSLGQAIIIAIFFIVYQQIENNAIQPYVQSRALEISPLLVLIAVILGVNFGGLIGGFIAIPTAACLRILLLDVIETRNRNLDSKSKLA